MMSDVIQITRYDRVDDDFNAIVELHKLISKGTNLYGHLIYFDANFPFFFRHVIANKTADFIYLLKINNAVSGFIHLKMFENTIFLNNICLNETCQGKGIGSYFLNETLKLVFDGSQENFELDVFLSNQKALRWYLSLGLEINKKSTWVKITSAPRQLDIENTPDMHSLKDNNGFDSISYRNNKVATIINNATMLIHDMAVFEIIPKQASTIITNQSVKELDAGYYQFITLETAARMSGRIQDVFNTLKKING